MTRLGVELRDLRDLILVPAFAAMLPRRLGWRLLRFAARFEGFFGQASAEALAGRLRFAGVGDERAWRQQLRLILLADACDFYVARFGGWRRIRKRIDEVEGAWPEGPFCALGLHWGAALWTLHHLKHAGNPAAMVLAPLDPSIASSRWFASRYWLARGREIERAGGGEAIFTGSGRARIEQRLDSGASVLCLADVPARTDANGVTASVLGKSVRLRRGLFELLAGRRTPLACYRMQLDLLTGARKLVIAPTRQSDNPDELAAIATDWLQQAVDRHDASWHLWRGFARQLDSHPTE